MDANNNTELGTTIATHALANEITDESSPSSAGSFTPIKKNHVKSSKGWDTLANDIMDEASPSSAGSFTHMRKKVKFSFDGIEKGTSDGHVRPSEEGVDENEEQFLCDKCNQKRSVDDHLFVCHDCTYDNCKLCWPISNLWPHCLDCGNFYCNNCNSYAVHPNTGMYMCDLCYITARDNEEEGGEFGVEIDTAKDVKHARFIDEERDHVKIEEGVYKIMKNEWKFFAACCNENKPMIKHVFECGACDGDMCNDCWPDMHLYQRCGRCSLSYCKVCEDYGTYHTNGVFYCHDCNRVRLDRETDGREASDSSIDHTDDEENDDKDSSKGGEM